MRSRFPLRLNLVAGPLLVLAAAGAFVQIERGIGSVAQSLPYVAHNLTVGAALAIAMLIWFASRLKVSATDIPLSASDLLRIFDAWDVVVDFGWPALVAAVLCVVSFLALLTLGRPLEVAWLHRLYGVAAVAALLAGSGAIQARIPIDDDVLTNNGPKIAQFFRSIYATPGLSVRFGRTSDRGGGDGRVPERQGAEHGISRRDPAALRGLPGGLHRSQAHDDGRLRRSFLQQSQGRPGSARCG